MKNTKSQKEKQFAEGYTCFWEKKNRVLVAVTSNTNTLRHHTRRSGKSILPVLPVKIKEENELNPEKCIRAINQVDDLNFKLACGASILSAIHEAIEYGRMEAGSYKDGLFGAYDYISTIQEEIQAVLDSCDEQPAIRS